MSYLFRLVSEGDSISAAASVPSHVWQLGRLTAAQIPGSTTYGSYSQQNFTFHAADMLCVNRAVGGSRLKTNGPSGSYPGDLTYRVASWIDALIGSGAGSGRKYILTVMIGTNPDTADYSQAAADLKTYLQTRVAVGFSGIVVGTILSRGDGILPDFETYRQGYNAILRTQQWQNDIGAEAFAVADFGNEPTIGAPGACYDSSLFADTVHPTARGYSYMAPIYSAAVDRVKALLLLAGRTAPVIDVGRASDNNPMVVFKGTLQQSQDLSSWQELTPQPDVVVEIPSSGPQRGFFRATNP